MKKQDWLDGLYGESDFVIILWTKYCFLMLRYKPVWPYHKQHLNIVSRPDSLLTGLSNSDTTVTQLPGHNIQLLN